MSAIVIVGAGPAGVAAAMAAGKAQGGHQVLLLSDEDRDPYEKPPLSKDVLQGKAEAGATLIIDPAALGAAGVSLMRGARVVGVDRARRTVRLADGRVLDYRALVLATGASARILPALPPGAANVHYLRSADDSARLHAALQRCAPASPVVVIGGGLIGLEAAASVAARGMTTTVIEAESSAMARVCSPDFARLIVERHERAGVRLRFGTTLLGASPTETGMSLRLSDGETVAAALAIVGIGATLNTELASGIDLPLAGGIVVDERGRTEDPAIFAAGDVVRFRSKWCAEPVRLENWRHALDHGSVVGANAAGGDAAYEATPSFWSDQYELKIQGAGWLDGLAAPPVRRTLGDGKLIEFHLVDGVLRYVVGIGAPRDIGIARRLIERQARVPTPTLADPSASLQALLRP